MLPSVLLPRPALHGDSLDIDRWHRICLGKWPAITLEGTQALGNEATKLRNHDPWRETEEERYGGRAGTSPVMPAVTLNLRRTQETCQISFYAARRRLPVHRLFPLRVVKQQPQLPWLPPSKLRSLLSTVTYLKR